MPFDSRSGHPEPRRGVASRGKRRAQRADAPVQAPAAARPHEQAAPKSGVREMFESICVAVILAFFVRTFVVQAFKIPSGSMEPNLLIGDHLLVNKFVSAPTLTRLEDTLLPIQTIQRGDVIVFKHPRMPERDLIKRTIGLPGETIELREKRVFVNGKPLDEAYAHFVLNASDVPPTDVRRNFGPVTVPPGHYFMMGDNRDNSEDSRYWGFLPREHVKGKALFLYISFGEGPGSVANVRWARILRQIH
jgi:signal peptidase I